TCSFRTWKARFTITLFTPPRLDPADTGDSADHALEPDDSKYFGANPKCSRGPNQGAKYPKCAIRTTTECGPARYVGAETDGGFSHSTMSCGESRAVSIQRRQGVILSSSLPPLDT